MEGCLLDVAELIETEVFKSSIVFAAWAAFYAVVQERLQFFKLFESTSQILLKGCDNMQCEKIRIKSDLRRCSTCLDSYYCSKQCQSVDWRAGHREDCLNFSGIRKLPEEEQCNTKDRKFLRALLHRDYLYHRAEILSQQITTMKQHPDQPCYVIFSYMKGASSVEVVNWPQDPTELLGFPPKDWIARYRSHGVRTAASAGRLELHMMVIPNGLKKHCKIMPLRYWSGGPEVSRALRQIVAKVADIPITDPEFESVVASELKSVLDLEVQIIYE
ncbi:hypothetical protein B0H11DRAFT_2236437 [Mycena galericulata]|nr:hypothetical protein B0H11DRAFT_2236437 [Mycena galericulata]